MLLFLLFALLLQGSGKKKLETGASYVYMARKYEVFPAPEGFRIRGCDLVKIVAEGPLFLCPLSGLHSSGPYEFRLVRLSFVRRDPETRNLTLLSEEGEHFPYELHEDRSVSGNVSSVAFYMEDTVPQMILEMEWDLTISAGSLQFFFPSGAEYRDSSRLLTLHNPKDCRILCHGLLFRKNENGAFVWSVSDPLWTDLLPEEIPEVIISLGEQREQKGVRGKKIRRTQDLP